MPHTIVKLAKLVIENSLRYSAVVIRAANAIIYSWHGRDFVNEAWAVLMQKQYEGTLVA